MTSNSKQRLLSLDLLRGMTVAGMILVNNGSGDSFAMLKHSEWNGMTPCDLVFPFFLYIMGLSTYLSLSKKQFLATKATILKIFRRTILLFLIGVGIIWFSHAVWGDPLCFDHLRIFAVLQRIALCYCFVSIFAVTVDHRYIIPTIIGLLGIYSALLIWGNGYAPDTSNIAYRIDAALLGESHLYHHAPIDPEGLLGTISAAAHALIGFYCGRQMYKADTIERKANSFFLTGTFLVIGGYLLSYGLPINKTVWSPSYVLVTCGLASLLHGAIMLMIDSPSKSNEKKAENRWTFFRVFGINPLALYVSAEVLSILLGRLGVSGFIYNVISQIMPWPKWTSLLYALCFVTLIYVIGYALYKKKIYIKL
jgi:predicted acyltransferase